MRLLRTTVAVLAALMFSHWTFAGDPAPIRLAFNIAPQPLSDALAEWSRQSGLQVLQRESDTARAEIISAKVSGEFSPAEALTRMLVKTGLTYEFVNDRTVRISPVGKESERRLEQEQSESPRTGEHTDTPPPSQGEGKGEDRRNLIEEVIVTANKIAEPLSKVPASIGVLTADSLASQHAVDMQDVISRVPGLSSDSRGAPGQSQFTIRGISPGGGTETTTGVYIDDVSINDGIGGFSGSYEPSFFDLDRIEVLRGPQGTLYGADSFGGTIRYVNKQPELDRLGGDVTANLYSQAHGDPNGSASGAINLPLHEHTLALRIAGLYQRDGGFIDHLNPAGAVVQNNTNVQDVYGVRSVLLWQPTDTVKVTPTFQYQTTRNADSWLYAANLGQYNTARLLDEPVHDRFLFSALNVNADFGASTLTSVSSYVDRRANVIRDFTIFDNSSYVAPGVASYFDPNDTKGSLEALSNIATAAHWHDTNRQSAQEIRLASHFDELGLRTLLGLYFAHEVRGHQSREVAAGFGAETQRLFGVGANQAIGEALGAGADLGDTLYAQDIEERIDRKAAYIEASWSPPHGLLQALTVTAGTRFSKIDYRQEGSRDGFFNVGYTAVNHKFNENQVAPKYRISYQASDNTLLYASASKGFRLGGTNQPLPPSCAPEVQSSGITPAQTYRTDSIWSYEAGTKIGLHNRAVQLNASAFHIDWTDVAESINFSNCGFPFIGNVGKATSDGGDVSLELRPIAGLEVELGAAYTKAQFRETITVLNIAKGSAVPFSPPWTTNINVDYSWPIALGTGYVRANYTYTDHSRGDLTVASANFMRPSYETAGASVGYRHDAWELSLYAKNLTDAHPPLYQETLFGYYNVSTLRPRQIGVEAKYAF